MLKLFENTGVGVATGGGIVAMTDPNTGAIMAWAGVIVAVIMTYAPKLHGLYLQLTGKTAHKCDEMAEIKTLLLKISDKLGDKPNGE
jgi:hypothetical protein